MTTDKKTGLVYDNDFLKHKAIIDHPERPERILAIMTALKNNDLLPKFSHISPDEASPEEVKQVHVRAYFEQVMTNLKDNRAGFLDMGDTFFSEGTKTAALKAVGGGIQMVTKIINGNLDSGIAILRPPGHHAEAEYPMGFCIFNNVAIAAQTLINQGVDKVAIVDFDVHHGNGTQHIFESSEQVFYASIHQFPLFPGTGDNSETGKAAGAGYTANVPMPPESTGKDWIYAVQSAIIPAVKEFNPDIILISAGFDAHKNDYISSQNLSDEDFFTIESELHNLATEVCGGKTAVFLEGGYNLNALSNGIINYFTALQSAPSPFSKVSAEEVSPLVKISVEKTLKNLKTYWHNL